MMSVKNSFLHLILISIFSLNTVLCCAQFSTAMIGVNGLTCSACTRTVEMSIRKLDFVKDVEMNLENTEGKIIFKENSYVDISKIAKAVVNAGFSVRYLSANYKFNGVNASAGYCYNAGNFNLQFVNTTDVKLNGETELKFLGKDYQQKSDLNKVKTALVSKCSAESGHTYFVTL